MIGHNSKGICMNQGQAVCVLKSLVFKVLNNGCFNNISNIRLLILLKFDSIFIVIRRQANANVNNYEFQWCRRGSLTNNVDQKNVRHWLFNFFILSRIMLLKNIFFWFLICFRILFCFRGKNKNQFIEGRKIVKIKSG